MRLRLPPRVTVEIQAHLCSAYPEEGCGVMLGREADGGREIERVIPFPNQREDSRRNRYLITPEQYLAADREARASGLDVIGFYHSHPDHPARPSAFDLEYAWPYYSYLIASVVRGRVADLRSWRLADDRSEFRAETLDALPEADTTARTRGDP